MLGSLILPRKNVNYSAFFETNLMKVGSISINLIYAGEFNTPQKK
jgi:hypothetical protein